MADIDWTLVARYAAGECSPEERARVEHQLAEPSRYPEALAAIDWVAAHADASVSPERRTALHTALRTRIAADRRPSRVAFALKIAAAVVLAVGVSVAGYVAWRRPARAVAGRPVEPGVRTIATAPGQRLSLRLSDGTLVVLAPASTLRVPSDYGGSARALELVGQAAFTVVYDARRPFTVRVGDLVATDLGTEFVLHAYPENPHAEVVVREGMVGIRAVAARDTTATVVYPGQRGRLSAAGRPVVQVTDAAAAFAWTEGRLVFQGTPLLEVVAQLERWYDVEIAMASPDLATKTVSGAIVESRPVSQGLETIAAVLHLVAVETGPRSYLLRAP